MSYAIPGIYEESLPIEQPAERDLIFVPRSRMQWVPFLIPLALCGISWMQGGVPTLTDAGFTIFTILCLGFLVMEFYRFPRRFGIGGLVLWGGVPCWFCHDYFTHWFNHDFTQGELDYYTSVVIPSWVIAKAAFLHVLFVMLMSISLNWKIGKWAEKLLLIVPDPGNDSFYLIVMLILFGFSLCPYVVFNAEPWYLCIYHALFSSWTGAAQLTVFRTGNINYNWGAYVAQIVDIGRVGGLVAIVYSILVARSWPKRLLGVFIWLFNAMIAFETTRRGEVAFALMPPIALLYISYQAKAAAMFKRFSIRSYAVCGFLTVVLLSVVQYQGTFRGAGFYTADISKLDITKNQGNTMFSEGLLGYSEVGVTMPFFYSSDFPGEGAIRAMPQTLFEQLIGPIPRALWNSKPIDPLWLWYNKEYTGINNAQGTTISRGLVGSWYFKYGFGGMIEGALLVGWLMGTSERALQHSEGKPISILMSLGFAVWIFRTYRDFIFIDLYALMLGAIALIIFVHLLRPLLGGAPGQQST